MSVVANENIVFNLTIPNRSLSYPKIQKVESKKLDRAYLFVNKISSAGRISHFSERKSTHIFSLFVISHPKTVVSNNFKGYFQLL